MGAMKKHCTAAVLHTFVFLSQDAKRKAIKCTFKFTLVAYGRKHVLMLTNKMHKVLRIHKCHFFWANISKGKCMVEGSRHLTPVPKHYFICIIENQVKEK